MVNVKSGKTIEKILSRYKKEKREQILEEKPSEKIYLKALPLRSTEEVELFKQEVKLGNILVVKISPLAKKSIDEVKRTVDELSKFVESVGGDIARLGEERIVITPRSVKIWREKAETPQNMLP